ncbi:methylated-DNA--[protein]-cysteine S-methyltransferase [Enhydrobacter sp.]|jgi:methylated-DNA-[protein]-cysteine S-methyltransferase|uniref:methylated-DNA--[protein]-cysteine S-methyltransferase n=1 Tax=Enhydrobacter sp. TaxID=1894999 RepID=UPI00261307F5|nr:methylated-DNA--[protein]-cysteine S-methyltransferase [Enhydrobacter sp.]WIM14231.1 MAG: Methylated-DNA--protein-cysteine methyltransferase [Enhydrobacter sp.]
MAEPLSLLIDRLATPIGELIVLADRNAKLRAIDWTDHEARLKRLLDRFYGKARYTLTPARDPGSLTSAMRRYFAGDIAILRSLPVATSGTPFQTSVWRALRRIKDGTTISYAELATRIGKPRAVRAASLANGQNPISIVVPCHRVIGSNGSLTGYGGGLDRKQWLLAHEGVRL